MAEECVSLRLTLELFYLVSCVALVFVIAMLNKIAQKTKKKHHYRNLSRSRAFL